jgi:hypothetical protein
LRLNVERHIRGQRVDRRKLESGGQIEHAGEGEAMALVIRRGAFFEDQPIGVERKSPLRQIGWSQSYYGGMPLLNFYPPLFY